MIGWTIEKNYLQLYLFKYGYTHSNHLQAASISWSSLFKNVTLIIDIACFIMLIVKRFHLQVLHTFLQFYLFSIFTF